MLEASLINLEADLEMKSIYMYLYLYIIYRLSDDMVHKTDSVRLKLTVHGQEKWQNVRKIDVL